MKRGSAGQQKQHHPLGPVNSQKTHHMGRRQSLLPSQPCSMRRRLVAPIDDCDLDDPLRDQNWLALASRDTAALPPRPRSLLGRCPNCGAYTLFHQAEVDGGGSECIECSWFQPPARLPVVLSPRVDAERRAREQRGAAAAGGRAARPLARQARRRAGGHRAAVRLAQQRPKPRRDGGARLGRRGGPVRRDSWWEMPSALFEDSAPFASLDCLKARAAPAHAHGVEAARAVTRATTGADGRPCTPSWRAGTGA